MTLQHTMFYIYAAAIIFALVMVIISISFVAIITIINLYGANKMVRIRRESEIWKLRSGRIVLLREMTDEHLANSIRMVARNCHRVTYLGNINKDKSLLKLTTEGLKRNFQITLLNSPIDLNGRQEYVNIFIPKNFQSSKLSSHMVVSELDSRCFD